MIISTPNLFHSYGFSKTHQQVLTGFSIATVDAVISTPLERAKIFSAFTGQGSFSFTHIYKNGWSGFTSYWAKRSINMSTFLVAQEYFRDNCHLQKERLSFLDLSKIGVKTALMVSMISAPFDFSNTRKQAENLSPLQLSSRQRIWSFYRGWPINALSLIIHNIASVTIIEKLRPN